MTIVSAASLPGHGHEAPLPTFRSFRRNGRRPVVPRITAAPAPRRHLPRTVLADDRPRGRILIVSGDAPLTLDVQSILHEAGYRAIGPAASADEAERLTACRPIDAALVDLQLEDGAAAVVADRLAHQGIPLVWLTDSLANAIPRSHGFAPMVTKPVDGEDLIHALERALESRARPGTASPYPVPPPQTAWPRVFPQL